MKNLIQQEQTERTERKNPSLIPLFLRFGRGDICSFAPDGNASPGSVYLADGVDRQSVVRVSPANGKIQVFDWQPGKKKWVRRM